jgi:hypothetical protein
MKTLMIFDRLVSLHRERHRGLRLDAARIDFRFAAETNSVPIALDELAAAALQYPCVFVEREGRHALCALGPQRNLFVDDQGRWQEGAYVPAYMRRYPYALAETGEADNFLVCIDEACAGLGTDAGEPLFAEDGSDGRSLAEAKAFLLALHQAFVASSAWCDEVAALGLLDDRVLRFERADGSAGELSGFKVIDEARLRQIPADVAERWLRQGHLLAAAAHLVSLGHAPRLGLLHARHERAAGQPPAAASAAAAPTPAAGATAPAEPVA